MGAPSDELVSIKNGQHKDDPAVITVSGPDQLGLACDLARILYEFGLAVVRGDLSTDGRWCLVKFWVTVKPGSAHPIKWFLLKKRLISVCPSTRSQLLLPFLSEPKPKEIFVLQACSSDRAGLLNDVAQATWELELTIHKMKVTTSPDGKAVNLFYITDVRETLQDKRRQEDVCSRLKTTLGAVDSSIEIKLAGPEWGGLDCRPASSLPPTIAEDLFSEGLAEVESDVKNPGAHGCSFQKASVTLDNSLSPGHTLLQISCKDRKGLLYDCMRALKDLQIQVAYGRLTTDSKGTAELDLFVLQRDDKKNYSKIIDPQKLKTLCSRLEMEIVQPIRVMVVNRGPDSDLIVATPMESSGRGRPRVLYDITSVLKTLNISIFQADIGRHIIGDQQWEIYRFLLVDKPEMAFASCVTRTHITESVRNILSI